jgi:hypothetical protein
MSLVLLSGGVSVILRLGVWARKQMEDETMIGKRMLEPFLQHENNVRKRRKPRKGPTPPIPESRFVRQIAFFAAYSLCFLGFLFSRAGRFRAYYPKQITAAERPIVKKDFDCPAALVELGRETHDQVEDICDRLELGAGAVAVRGAQVLYA